MVFISSFLKNLRSTYIVHYNVYYIFSIGVYVFIAALLRGESM